MGTSPISLFGGTLEEMEKNKLVERNWWVQFDERNSCFAEFRLYRPSFPILRWTDLIHFSQPAKYSWRNFGPREKLFPRSSKPVLSTLHFSTFGTEKRRINLPFYRMRKIPNEYFNSNDFHPELMIDWIEKEEKRKSVCDCIIGTRLFASRLRFAQEERYVSLSRRVSSWLHFISSTYAFDIKTNCRCCAGYSSTTFLLDLSFDVIIIPWDRWESAMFQATTKKRRDDR